LPGIVVGICAAVYCIWYALKQNISSGRSWSLREIVATSRQVVWTLGAPGVIFGGIYGGFMTPIEAAMAVSVYAVLVCVLIYRELSWAQVWKITRETAVLSAKIFIIVVASGVFSWIPTAEQVPQKFVVLISDQSLSQVMILLLVSLVLLLVGMFLDPNSAVLLFTPLPWPIAQYVGVDLIHFGIIMTVKLAIGMFSPPFALTILAPPFALTILVLARLRRRAHERED
jgi:C4-dicarboxylate transporter, DctM subunit